jgi:hypothetical protein
MEEEKIIDIKENIDTDKPAPTINSPTVSKTPASDFENNNKSM